jgi:hypothetical protein
MFTTLTELAKLRKQGWIQGGGGGGNCTFSSAFAITVTYVMSGTLTVFLYIPFPGADPGFSVRGGALKKIASSENFWGISLS